MLKVRLRRPGKSIKGRRHQKIVVTESSWARESKFIDEIGYYDPSRELLKIDTDKYKEWIQKGAQPSETVASLFKNYGKPKRARAKKPKPEAKVQKPDTEAGLAEAQKESSEKKEEAKEPEDSDKKNEKVQEN